MKAYHVTDTGEAVEIELRDTLLESLDAVLVLDDQQDELWVLRGPLEVRKKFLVARAAANLNLMEGLRFRIRHVEPHERSKVIHSLFAGEEPKLPSIAEFPDAEESHPVPTPAASKQEEFRQPPKVSVPVLEEQSIPSEERAEILPTDISSVFESFTQLALFERSFPKNNLPPRAELEKRLQQYLKTFIDALYG